MRVNPDRRLSRHSPHPWNILLPGVFVLLLALGWYMVWRQAQTLHQTVTVLYQQTQLELVRSMARSIEAYLRDRLDRPDRSLALADLEQEIFERFIAPVHLLENGDAWIYAPDHVVYDRSSDFPDIYRGKSMAQIFALQVKYGASHYEEMTDEVMNAREGVGWYIWLPDKGQEIAAWTPVRVGDYTWTIGLSTPLPEILASTGATAQVQTLTVIMSVTTLVSLLMLLGWGYQATQQHRIEQALRQSQDLFHSLVESLPQNVYTKDLQGRLTYANQRYCQIQGKPLADLLGKTHFELHPPDLAAKYDADDRYVLASGQTFETVEEHQPVGGAERMYVQVTKTPLYNPQGQIIGTLGNFWDVTERRRMETALRESEERFRSIVMQLSDIVWILERDIRIKYVTPSCRVILGYEPEAVIGKIGMEWIHPDDVPIAGQAFNEVIAKENLFTPSTFRFRHAAGHWVQLEAIGNNMLDHPIIQGIVLTTRDVTDRMQAEAERERLITELEAKNAELEAFTYTASHDLKSPLITISSFLGWLEKDLTKGDAARIQADIQRIRSATQNMGQLLNDLLKLSRIGRVTNPPQAVPLAALVQEALALVTGQVTARGVQVNVAPNLPVVCGDRQRLVEVLQNLLDNAVKFMGDQPEPRIEIGVQPGGGNKVCCYVRDNGIGLAPRYHEQIFGLFRRLDPHTPGTGIGLALVKRIIEVHNGRVWVESEPGRGATFYFTLEQEPEMAVNQAVTS